MIDVRHPEEHVERRWHVWYYPEFVGVPPEPAPRYLVAQFDDKSEAERLARQDRNYRLAESLRWRLLQG